ncbi:MAG: hypothetical protein R3277_07380 [Brumimicrobium sp.]|nr:hypothetical protein [Brumimicrobium sp.]
MLRIFLVLLLGGVINFVSYSQNSSSLSKVEEFLGEQKYAELQNTNPGLIKFLVVRVEDGYLVSESIEEKKSSYIKIDHVFFKKEQISVEDFIEHLNQEEFNILLYNFPGEDSESTNHFLLGDSGILLTVFSNKAVNLKASNSN